MENYISFAKKKKFIGAQPVTLTRNSFIKTDYFLTEKLDGKRHLIFISEKDTFIITSKLEFSMMKLTNKTLFYKGTILDCEMYNKKFYVFDILYYKGRDVRNEKFRERINMYNDVIKNINSKKLLAKPQIFIPSEKTCEKITSYVDKIKHRFKEGDLDGIILTPDDIYYSKILKYKPFDLLSIDFKIRKDNGNFLLLLQNDKLFKPRDARYKDVGVVKVSKEIYDTYQDNSVVEFIFKNNKFSPIRARPDKIMSNALFVILDNFKLMTSNTDLKKIIC